jgi:hypothetical protein
MVNTKACLVNDGTLLVLPEACVSCKMLGLLIVVLLTKTSSRRFDYHVCFGRLFI